MGKRADGKEIKKEGDEETKTADGGGGPRIEMLADGDHVDEETKSDRGPVVVEPEPAPLTASTPQPTSVPAPNPPLPVFDAAQFVAELPLSHALQPSIATPAAPSSALSHVPAAIPVGSTPTDRQGLLLLCVSVCRSVCVSLSVCM